MDNQVELFEDVKIFNQNISADTIQINSGACEVDSQSDNPYVPYAIIPKNDWRELTEAEHDALVGTDKTLPASSSVGVINVPEETFIPLKREGFYNLTSESEITTFLKRGDLSAIYKPFYELFLNHLRKNDGVALTPFLTKPPNQVTVTVNIIDGVSRKVGIHVDTWDKLCMKDLSQARNRICINGGVEERYFLFYNITLNTISKILEKERGKRYRATLYLTSFAK